MNKSDPVLDTTPESHAPGLSPLGKILSRVYGERKQKNASYSLRAFSRDLCVSHTTVARALDGKSNISLTNTKKIASRLKLFDQDLSLLLYGTRLSAESDSKIRELLSEKLRERERSVNAPLEIQLEDLQGLPELTVFKVLESFQLADKKSGFTFDQLQERNKVSSQVLKKILARLRVLKLIAFDKSQTPTRYVRLIQRWEIRAKNHHSGFKALHTQGAEAGIKALNQFGPGDRYSATEFVPVPESAKAEFMEACHEFLEKLHEITARDPNPESVYLVSLQAFPWLRSTL